MNSSIEAMDAFGLRLCVGNISGSAADVKGWLGRPVSVQGGESAASFLLSVTTSLCLIHSMISLICAWIVLKVEAKSSLSVEGQELFLVLQLLL